MGWIAERFGDGSDATDLLTIFSRRAELGTAPVPARLVQTAGGYYDPDGDDRPRQSPLSIVVDGKLYGDDRESALRALTADIGRRAKLYRRWSGDDAVQWARARLLSVTAPSQWGVLPVLPVTLTYQSAGPWNGGSSAAWYLDSGEYLDAGLTFDGSATEITISGPSGTATVNNPGNIRQRNLRLVIQPTGTVTSLTISCAALGISLTYDGGLSALNALTIDSETLSVTDSSGDAWDDLTINSGHTLDGLLAVDPGDNTFTFDFDSGVNIAVTFDFYGAWA